MFPCHSQANAADVDFQRVLFTIYYVICTVYRNHTVSFRCVVFKSFKFSRSTVFLSKPVETTNTYIIIIIINYGDE